MRNDTTGRSYGRQDGSVAQGASIAAMRPLNKWHRTLVHVPVTQQGVGVRIFLFLKAGGSWYEGGERLRRNGARIAWQ